MSRTYKYRHVVGFEETNLTGNVYYSHHIEWQGRCRELFLRDHAPDILRQLGEDLALVTLHCSCDYLAELAALDEVTLEMRLGGVVQNRIELGFEYWNEAAEGGRSLVARGKQTIACMRRTASGLTPAPVPDALRTALAPYADSGAPESIP